LAEQEQPLRFGIIGCGTIGPTHAGALAQISNVEIAAVCDPIRERAERMAAKFNVLRVYDGHRALIEDPELDAVCVCTPSGMHADIASQALGAGRHVIVEKPMDVSLEACDRLIAAEDSSGKVLSIISQHRFDRASQIVKEAIDSGRLGKIVLADASVKWWRTQAYYDFGRLARHVGDGRRRRADEPGRSHGRPAAMAGRRRAFLVVPNPHGRARAHRGRGRCRGRLALQNGAAGTLTATTAAYEGFPVRIDIYGTEGTAIIEGDRLKMLRFKSGETFESEEAAAHALSVASGGTASVRDEAATGRATTAADPGAVWGDAHRTQFEDFFRHSHRRQAAH
jgi:predicted dehydrogenase